MVTSEDFNNSKFKKETKTCTKKSISIKEWSTTTPRIHYFTDKCLKNLGACEGVAVHMMGILHPTSVIRDFTFYIQVSAVCVTPFKHVQVKLTLNLFKHIFKKKISLIIKPFFLFLFYQCGLSQIRGIQSALLFLHSSQEPIVQPVSKWGSMHA